MTARITHSFLVLLARNLVMRLAALVGLTTAVLVLASCGGSPTPASPAPPGDPLATTNADRFVATDGSDASPDCARARPCRTIQRAHDVATAGEEVAVARGTYDERLRISKGIHIDPQGNQSDTRLRGNVEVGLTGGTFKWEGFTLTPGGGAINGFDLTLYAGSKVVVNFTAIGAYAEHGILARLAGGELVVAANVSSNRNSGDGLHVEGNGSLRVQGIELRENAGDGLQLAGVNGISATIDFTAFRLNGEAGFQIENMRSGSVTIDGSCVFNNGSQAGLTFSNLLGGTVTVSRTDIAFNRTGGASILASTITPNLTGNWWNSPSGPSGAGGGSGDSISSGLMFVPVATSPQLPNFSVSECR